MKFAECYNKYRDVRPVLSFELFPPKTEKAEAQFEKVLPELIDLKPDFITVTYGAMGSTRDRTIDIASAVKKKYGIETACHLTCVGSTSEEIEGILDRIRAGHVENIVALRGDPPQGETEFQAPEGGYSHAIELVNHIQGRKEFGIAVAAYPEKHIEAPDFETDLAHFKNKVEAGADVAITQLFYDNQDFFDFADRARESGVACPIVPGLLPIVSATQVKRVTSMCGARIPQSFLESLEATGDDAEAAFEIGVGQAVEQVTQLLERGVPGIHFYVLNRSRHMMRIFEALSKKGVVTS